MSLSPRCFAHAQISFVVANTTKKNYKANCAEIAKVVYIGRADFYLMLINTRRCVHIFDHR